MIARAYASMRRCNPASRCTSHTLDKTWSDLITAICVGDLRPTVRSLRMASAKNVFIVGRQGSAMKSRSDKVRFQGTAAVVVPRCLEGNEYGDDKMSVVLTS